MGKGDQKSKKGKIWKGTSGKTRPARKANVLTRKAALKKALKTALKYTFQGFFFRTGIDFKGKEKYSTGSDYLCSGL